MKDSLLERPALSLFNSVTDTYGLLEMLMIFYEDFRDSVKDQRISSVTETGSEF